LILYSINLFRMRAVCVPGLDEGIDHRGRRAGPHSGSVRS
jgi:hypothetical protein